MQKVKEQSRGGEKTPLPRIIRAGHEWRLEIISRAAGKVTSSLIFPTDPVLDAAEMKKTL